jgi:hypothetical protein
MSDTTTRQQMVIPTPRNLLRLANDNIMTNLRRRQDADIGFPSLYRLAFAVVYNTGEILVEVGKSQEGM